MAQARPPRLILLCGLPGAGKTTLARRLARDVPAIRLGADEWMARLGVDLHDERLRDRLGQLLWRLARELLRLGASAISEFGSWARSERDEKRRWARGLGIGVELHLLDAPTEDLWRRIGRRNGERPFGGVPISREQFERYLTLFEAPQRAELDPFDEPTFTPSGDSPGQGYAPTLSRRASSPLLLHPHPRRSLIGSLSVMLGALSGASGNYVVG